MAQKPYFIFFFASENIEVKSNLPMYVTSIKQSPVFFVL